MSILSFPALFLICKYYIQNQLFHSFNTLVFLLCHPFQYSAGSGIKSAVPSWLFPKISSSAPPSRRRIFGYYPYLFYNLVFHFTFLLFIFVTAKSTVNYPILFLSPCLYLLFPLLVLFHTILISGTVRMAVRISAPVRTTRTGYVFVMCFSYPRHLHFLRCLCLPLQPQLLLSPYTARSSCRAPEPLHFSPQAFCYRHLFFVRRLS